MSSRNYRGWKILQSFSVFLFIYFSLTLSRPALIHAAAAVLYINMCLLAVLSGKEILRLSNAVTMIRAFGTIPLMLAGIFRPAVILYIIFLELTDLADGFIARRRGATAAGAILDEETDALFTLILSYLLYDKIGFGPWILSFGALRYIFVLFFLVTGTAERYPSSFARFSKFTCAFTISTLIGGFAGFLPMPVRKAALYSAFTLLTLSFLWETKIHLRSGPAGRYLGLLRSFIIYYLIPSKSCRMKKLYSKFLKPGSIAFDIGSHIGNRIGVWSRLGAVIVAVEPDQLCVDIIKALHGKRKNLTILQAAAGEVKGNAVLHIDPYHPTLSTLSGKWIETVKKTRPFNPVDWTLTRPVEVLTLDELTGKYGIPDFCKIDVEGFELEVLKGLSHALPALSVEYLPSAHEMAEECLDRINQLGNYEFNLSKRETMRFLWSSWKSDKEVRRFLRMLRPGDLAGDIYARLREV